MVIEKYGKWLLKSMENGYCKVWKMVFEIVWEPWHKYFSTEDYEQKNEHSLLTSLKYKKVGCQDRSKMPLHQPRAAVGCCQHTMNSSMFCVRCDHTAVLITSTFRCSRPNCERFARRARCWRLVTSPESLSSSCRSDTTQGSSVATPKTGAERAATYRPAQLSIRAFVIPLNLTSTSAATPEFR